MFNRDMNRDAPRDEMELACMELHRERLSLASSMQDINSAVARLDNILMSVYTIVISIVFAVVLDTSVSALLSGAAAFVLALSWLIGASAQEVLSSVIFLFIKHMYDVGDRVEIDGQLYTVKEFQLCVTIPFLCEHDADGVIGLALSSLISEVPLSRLRMSCSTPSLFSTCDGASKCRKPSPLVSVYSVGDNGCAVSSIFVDVAFDTTFEQIEELRSRMLVFVEAERRDFLALFDVTIDSERLPLQLEG